MKIHAEQSALRVGAHDTRQIQKGRRRRRVVRVEDHKLSRFAQHEPARVGTWLNDHLGRRPYVGQVGKRVDYVDRPDGSALRRNTAQVTGASIKPHGAWRWWWWRRRRRINIVVAARAASATAGQHCCAQQCRQEVRCPAKFHRQTISPFLAESVLCLTSSLSRISDESRAWTAAARLVSTRP